MYIYIGNPQLLVISPELSPAHQMSWNFTIAPPGSQRRVRPCLLQAPRLPPAGLNGSSSMENPHVACLKNNSQGGMWIEASKVAQWLKYSVFFLNVLLCWSPHNRTKCTCSRKTHMLGTNQTAQTGWKCWTRYDKITQGHLVNCSPNNTGWWLSPTPLKNMSSSVGMMKFPIYGQS
jgi:hypothetical protein